MDPIWGWAFIQVQVDTDVGHPFSRRNGGDLEQGFLAMAGWVGAILFLQLIGVRRDTWFVSEDQSTEQGFFARFEGQMIGHKIGH